MDDSDTGHGTGPGAAGGRASEKWRPGGLICGWRENLGLVGRQSSGRRGKGRSDWLEHVTETRNRRRKGSHKAATFWLAWADGQTCMPVRFSSDRNGKKQGKKEEIRLTGEKVTRPDEKTGSRVEKVAEKLTDKSGANLTTWIDLLKIWIQISAWFSLPAVCLDFFRRPVKPKESNK